MRKREIDEAGLLATRGVAPESIPDYLALVGDAADGIPGVAGFGKKTAATLLSVYRRLEKIPLRAAEWPPALRGAATLAASLAANMESALLYRQLATLIRTVPLPESLEELRWRGVPRARFEDWCRAMGASEDLRAFGLRFAEPRGGG
jgi:5'-3' exonuclease